MKLIERVSFQVNDDGSVSIGIDPCLKSDGDDRVLHYEGELTATAKNMEEAINKVREMVSLKSKKGTKPKNILSEYLKA